MPWKVNKMLDVRREFVEVALAEGAQVAELCRRFRVSRKTGDKWLGRYGEAGVEGLSDRSRRPACSPSKTSAEAEAEVIALRQEHPAWGGRKLRRWLLDRHVPDVPAASTITEILRRHGLLAAEGVSAA